MTDEHSIGAGGGVLTHDTPIEADVIGRPGSDSKGCRLAVDGDPPGPDPLFSLAARGQAGARQQLLQAFGLCWV